MRELILILPLPPSLNNAYENTGRGRRLTNEAAAYKDKATMQARVQAVAGGWCYNRRERIKVTAILWFPSARSSAASDIDNRFKLGGDCVAEALGYNDHVVDRIVLERGGVDAANPRVELLVVALPAPAKSAKKRGKKAA